jgi:hypothetical protein
LVTYLRGTEEKVFTPPSGTLGPHVLYPVVLPFDEEIQSFDSTATYYKDDGTRLLLDELITVVPHNPSWSRDYLEEVA